MPGRLGLDLSSQNLLMAVITVLADGVVVPPVVVAPNKRTIQPKCSVKSVLRPLWSTLRTTELLCQLSCEHRPRSLTQKPAWHDHWGIALTKCAGQPFG